MGYAFDKAKETQPKDDDNICKARPDIREIVAGRTAPLFQFTAAHEGIWGGGGLVSGHVREKLGELRHRHY